MALKLIVALDYENKNEALNLVDRIDPATCALKIGSEMFTLFGSGFIHQLANKGFKVFLDLKFHDIPNTVAKACRAAAQLGVWMINVHASGGQQMMTAAREAIENFGPSRPLLIAVTVLTSISEQQLAHIGVKSTLLEQVLRLSKLAYDSQLDGVVCSAQEASCIKKTLGSHFITVTPGIRLAESTNDDQARVMTPLQAIQAGSDYLVVGRSITQSADPASSILRICNQI